ncbi:hypothetical protein HYZ99_03895 [Candidatus Peregrinibacteria bacterium]|nr:hypothetical protein [Candidatus Peregrinibacteria bacterium]
MERLSPAPIGSLKAIPLSPEAQRIFETTRLERKLNHAQAAELLEDIILEDSFAGRTIVYHPLPDDKIIIAAGYANEENVQAAMKLMDTPGSTLESLSVLPSDD